LPRILLATKPLFNQTTAFYEEMPDPSGHRSALQLPSLTGHVLPAGLQEWNRTYRDYPLDKTIAWFLEAQAGKTPSQLALIADGESLTYRELNHQANELAHHLRGLGVRPDTLVGVHMERSVEMVVALLAVVKAGGAYVPFDPEYPRDRLAFMLADSEVSVLLSQESLRMGLPAAEVSTICLDSAEWSQRRRASTAENPPITVQPDNLVYMIYTSGSTGKPKGVPNVHRGLVNRLLWMQEAFQLDAHDRVLQKTPFSFDVSVWEFFWPLMTGATLVMAKPGGHKDSAYLVDTIVRHGITTMHFVPSMLSLFVAAEGLESAACLRRVMCSGEALPLELTKRFFARFPGVELHNLYGPTEAAIDVSHWHCKPDSARNVVPIGFPIANTQLYILAEDMNPVPQGEAGELHIGGVGLARGYWRREELTRERFIADPFSSDENAMLYKTGDLARHLPNGAIEYLGRLDFQVKIRGFRIELGEIEAALLKHAAIAEAIAIATDDVLVEKQLVAYLVSSKEAAPSIEDLRKWLLTGLPDYMVPARFIFLDKMPLLPSGKVDRKALPREQTQMQRPSLSQTYVAARNELEISICRIWQAILRLESVGAQDNFFELGGNSLLALQAAEELREVVGQEVPVVQLYQHPTVERLAHALSRETKDAGSALIDSVADRASKQRQALQRRDRRRPT
jgi:amino acid adenylation domain-containing protein